MIDFNKLLDTDREIEDSKNLLKENRNDKEMESLINEELTYLEECKNRLIQKATIALLPKDPRAKERRKYGLKKARKAPQFSKR